MYTNNLTAEEVFDLLESKQKFPVCSVFYLETGTSTISTQLSSITLDFRNRRHGIEKLEFVMNAPSFISWLGLYADEPKENSKSSVIEDWHKQWKY